MARIPLLVVPTGHVPPSRRCEQCAEDRQDATETTVRKRPRKTSAVPDPEPVAADETPAPESAESAAES